MAAVTKASTTKVSPKEPLSNGRDPPVGWSVGRSQALQEICLWHAHFACLKNGTADPALHEAAGVRRGVVLADTGHGDETAFLRWHH